VAAISLASGPGARKKSAKDTSAKTKKTVVDEDHGQIMKNNGESTYSSR
jgi:hypothetical protein